MFIIQGFLTSQPKLPMNYKHLSQAKRYQIYSLMQTGHSKTQIAQVLCRDKSTIGRELKRNRGLKGYQPAQACELSAKRSKQSRNATTVPTWVSEQAAYLLSLQWSPEQIAGKLPVSHETLYLHIYADKVQGGRLWKNLHCQKQKRKRYASGKDRRGQSPHRRPLSERPLHIEARKQVGHWECDTVIGAKHKGAIVTMVERKSGFSVIAKVSNKTFELVSQAIIKGLRPYADRVKTLTCNNDKEFAGHIQINQAHCNRPRKRLGLKTPAEVFHQSLKRVALRT